MHCIPECFVQFSELFYECTRGDGAFVGGVLGYVDIEGAKGREERAWSGVDGWCRRMGRGGWGRGFLGGFSIRFAASGRT